MLSGIGPPATLAKHSVPLLSALSGVGQNLRDQIFFNILRPISTPNTGTFLASPSQQHLALQQYKRTASGPYSSAGGYLSFEKLPPQFRANLSTRTTDALSSNYPTDWPEIEYIASGFPSGNKDLPTVGVISATLLTPLSRGTVTLCSTNSTDSPVIDMKWLSDPSDGEILVAAFKRVREAWNVVAAMANITVGSEVVPGASVQTDAQILEFVTGAVQPIWHASSTCKMGRRGDEKAVVDSRARVIGVERLRVVDASVFPAGLPGHLMASVYALAEKIADDILKGE